MRSDTELVFPEHDFDEVSTLRVLLDASKVAVTDLQAARDMAHAAILDGVHPRTAYGGDYGQKLERLMTLSRARRAGRRGTA